MKTLRELSTELESKFTGRYKTDELQLFIVFKIIINPSVFTLSIIPSAMGKTFLMLLIAKFYR